MNLHLVPSPAEEAIAQLVNEFRLNVEKQREQPKYPPPPDEDE